jgi:tRNA threonylcarbamoyladenosine biosynthesis protein TsaE
METIESNNVSATEAFGRKFARQLRQGDCVALLGPLGAGKTVLVRGIAEGLGLAEKRMVSSPTFVLVQEYPGRIPIYHLDLYRLPNDPAALENLGLEEMLRQGVTLVEWADRIPDALPAGRWEIRIEITGPRRRDLPNRPIRLSARRRPPFKPSENFS